MTLDAWTKWTKFAAGPAGDRRRRRPVAAARAAPERGAPGGRRADGRAPAGGAGPEPVRGLAGPGLARRARLGEAGGQLDDVRDVAHQRTIDCSEEYPLN